MRRAVVIAVALGIALAAGSGAATGAVCPNRLSFHRLAYRSVITQAQIPVGARLGKGTVMSSCATTHISTPGGYSAAVAGGEPGVPVRRVVYAVDGLRPELAIAVKGRRTALYVSKTTPTASELRILRRLRGG